MKVIVDIYIGIPLILILLMALLRQRNTFFWMLNVLSFGSILVFLWATSRWEMVSIYLRTVFSISFILTCVGSYMRRQTPLHPPSKMGTILAITTHFVFIGLFSVLNWFTFKGFSPPAKVINLASPLRNGSYIVLHGGASPLLNAHFFVPPQTYAMDILKINKLGMRAKSVLGGPVLEDYEIFGERRHY